MLRSTDQSPPNSVRQYAVGEAEAQGEVELGEVPVPVAGEDSEEVATTADRMLSE